MTRLHVNPCRSCRSQRRASYTRHLVRASVSFSSTLHCVRVLSPCGSFVATIVTTLTQGYNTKHELVFHDVLSGACLHSYHDPEWVDREYVDNDDVEYGAVTSTTMSFGIRWADFGKHIFVSRACKGKQTEEVSIQEQVLRFDF